MLYQCQGHRCAGAAALMLGWGPQGFAVPGAGGSLHQLAEILHVPAHSLEDQVASSHAIVGSWRAFLGSFKLFLWVQGSVLL